MPERTAVVVGATGAIGRELVPLLAASPEFDKIIVVHRRPTPFAGIAKLEERIVDFGKLPASLPVGPVDIVFCCIGTTQKKAGSTPAFQAVDRDVPVDLAKWAAGCGGKTFVAISSLGADADARSVYLRTKGEMERGVAAAGVRATYLLRPSLLKGERDEFRLAERIGNRALAIVDPLMVGSLRRYRAVPTDTVAKAMIACALAGQPGSHVVESEAIQELGA